MFLNRAAGEAPHVVRGVIAGFSSIPSSGVILLARLSMADIFWTSGRTKVEAGSLFTMSDGTVQLFRDEYKVSFPTPESAAYLTIVGEHLFPVLLVIGLASRFAALGMLCMTIVIEVFVYPDAYEVHGPWAVCLLLIMMKGPGVLSLDHLVARAFSRPG